MVHNLGQWTAEIEIATTDWKNKIKLKKTNFLGDSYLNIYIVYFLFLFLKNSEIKME